MIEASSQMNDKIPNEPHKAVLRTAVAATVLIAVGAFVLSFAALTDLAQRSGIDANLAWIWPIIVDGMIVASTVAIVALNGHSRRAMIYPWSLLFFGAIVSTAANSVHAILTVGNMDTGIPPVVSALVAAMPPVVLLAITHLTVHMYQKKSEAAELRAAAEFDEQAVENEKYGIAYDDGFQAAMNDAQAAEADRLEAAKTELIEATSRARAEGRADANKSSVGVKNSVPASAYAENTNLSANSGSRNIPQGKAPAKNQAANGASPLYDEIAQTQGSKN
jgi:hypothetical protein